METSASYYQLPPRTQLVCLSDQKIAIRKVIRSRIIRKDAEKIVALAQQIQRISPGLEVALICTANICSKSVKLLSDAEIELHYTQLDDKSSI